MENNNNDSWGFYNPPEPVFTEEDLKRLNINVRNKPAFIQLAEVWAAAVSEKTPWYAFFYCGTNCLRIATKTSEKDSRWELIEIKEKPRCECCGKLPPHTAVYEDEDIDWCIDCASAEGLLSLSQLDCMELDVLEIESKIKYHEEKQAKLLKKLESLKNEIQHS